MKGIETNSLILKCTDYGESDRIVTFVSREMGKISGIAKGARRSLKRFAACLEPFSLVSLVVRPKPGLSFLEEGRVVKDFREIKGDIEKVAYGSYLLELTDAMTGDGLDLGPCNIYSLLLGGIEALSVSNDPLEVVREYEVKILKMAGYMPSLLRCVSCGEELAASEGATSDNAVAFSRSRGGVECSSCRSETGEHMEFISLGTLKTLDAAAEKKVSFTKNALEESARIIPPFISHHLGKRLKSLDFIDKIKMG